MEFQINDDRVDAAHRLILQLFSSFDGLPKDVSEGAITDLLDRVKDHVTEHFAEEEQIFEIELGMSAEYVAEHKADHVRLRTFVDNAILRFSDDPTPSIQPLVGELRQEIEDHIMEIDSRMATHIQSRETPPSF